VNDLERFVTNQIPSFTSGTMTSRATDLFVGDFRQLLIGQRLSMTVQTLTERYAELGQIGIVAHWRGDVQLARSRALAVYRYLQGAA
jgi:HK97 family phage major capsid protein